jgi:hydrogenase-4 component F
LLGIVALGHVSIAHGIPPAAALSWDAIEAHGTTGATPLARVAIALMLVGFATKAGLVPMHAWLPDAHSKAPAPISGLLSGVLVSCALYAIMRTLGVANALGAGPFAADLLVWFGALSAVTAGALMLAQTDLKRLLAYSTVEHAGIVALALGFGGPLGWFAALLHVAAHAATKCAAFFMAGIVAQECGSTELRRVRALWTMHPAGGLMLAALAALCGLPPFGLFVSEVLVVLAGISAHRYAPLAFGVLGLALAFAAIARVAIEIEGGVATHVATRRSGRFTALTTTLALCCALGVAIVPWSTLGSALLALAASAGGTP